MSARLALVLAIFAGLGLAAPAVVDHGHAGTPTVRVDLDAIEASHERARAAFEGLRPSAPPAPSSEATLAASFRTGLPRASGGPTVRRVAPDDARRFLPAGTELYFFAADAPEDLAALAALPPHVEAYAIRYTSLAQVLGLATGRRVQPLADDHLPRGLGVAAYPARVVVLEDGALEIHEGL